MIMPMAFTLDEGDKTVIVVIIEMCKKTAGGRPRTQVAYNGVAEGKEYMSCIGRKPQPAEPPHAPAGSIMDIYDIV